LERVGDQLLGVVYLQPVQRRHQVVLGIGLGDARFFDIGKDGAAGFWRRAEERRNRMRLFFSEPWSLGETRMTDCKRCGGLRLDKNRFIFATRIRV